MTGFTRRRKGIHAQKGESNMSKTVNLLSPPWLAIRAQLRSILEAWAEPRRSPMCGNSICQDRRFLARYMPALERFFHYRNLDVSTLKELAQRWAPHIAAAFHKNASHLAQDDVRESIRELEHYRQHLLRPLGIATA